MSRAEPNSTKTPARRVVAARSALPKSKGPETVEADAPADQADSTAAPADKALRRRRSNRRSEQTIAKILVATEQVVLESGADRISILDVCAAAEVSRGKSKGNCSRLMN